MIHVEVIFFVKSLVGWTSVNICFEALDIYGGVCYGGGGRLSAWRRSSLWERWVVLGLSHIFVWLVVMYQWFFFGVSTCLHKDMMWVVA